MVVLGGSSLHKGANGLERRPRDRLPAGLTGNVGIPGGGFGPRHGSASHGQGLIEHHPRRTGGRPEPGSPSQMPLVTEAMLDGRVRAMLLLGTNMLSSYADAGRVARGARSQDLVVSYDLFLNDTARRFADVVLPATAWLEELGCKSTNTHLYSHAEGARPAGRGSASRLVPTRAWREGSIMPTTSRGKRERVRSTPSSTIRQPATPPRPRWRLRRMRALRISHVAHPDLKFARRPGKIELIPRERRARPALRSPCTTPPASSSYPLTLCQGRT
jgi:hypothetical protein